MILLLLPPPFFTNEYISFPKFQYFSLNVDVSKYFGSDINDNVIWLELCMHLQNNNCSAIRQLWNPVMAALASVFSLLASFVACSQKFKDHNGLISLGWRPLNICFRYNNRAPSLLDHHLEFNEDVDVIFAPRDKIIYLYNGFVMETIVTILKNTLTPAPCPNAFPVSK